MPLLHIMGRLIEDDLPAFGFALAAEQAQVAHPTAACIGFLRRLADAGRPADLNLTRLQFVTKRAALRAMLEQRYRHVSDHARHGYRQSSSWIPSAGCLFPVSW